MQKFIVTTEGMGIGVVATSVLWALLEYYRIRFGYEGNIGETFPEMIAFLIFSGFFCLPLSVLPLVVQVKFPHENCTAVIQLLFLVCELVMAFSVMRGFMNSQSASFYLRTAPIIDTTFAKKHSGGADFMTEKDSRELELGVQKLKKDRDAVRPFKDSDDFIEDKKVFSR